MKLLYVLLACTAYACASHKEGSLEHQALLLRRQSQSMSSLRESAAALGIKGTQKTAEKPASKHNDNHCLDTCIGATAGVCCMTALGCCYFLYITKPK